jgi:single-stranded-DNA-specific exonuclease
MNADEKREMTDPLMQAMQQAAASVAKWPRKQVDLLHHNDADGLTSGAILTRAFERAGFSVRRCCLEKTYPIVLKKVLAQKDALIVFADFAGRIAALISELNAKRNLVLILDHHKASPATDPMVHHLNPERFGFKGDRDITASTTCYLFAVTLDPVNSDLAGIAVVGAVGDRFFVDGRLAAKNRETALAAQRRGLLAVIKDEDAEQYILLTPNGPVACSEMASWLDTLGAAGYFQGGPEAGIQVCLKGMTTASERLLENLQNIQSTAFIDRAARLKEGEINHTEHIQWFDVGTEFLPMGVKTIGSFCAAYKDTDLFDPCKYIAGFQVVPNEIPGFGPAAIDAVKISMRVPHALQERIRSGHMPGLDDFLPDATAKLGGFSDACHSLAAATTLARGQEAALVVEMEKMLNRILTDPVLCYKNEV